MKNFKKQNVNLNDQIEKTKIDTNILRVNKKQLSFSELMKKAANINHENLALKLYYQNNHLNPEKKTQIINNLEPKNKKLLVNNSKLIETNSKNLKLSKHKITKENAHLKDSKIIKGKLDTKLTIPLRKPSESLLKLLSEKKNKKDYKIKIKNNTKTDFIYESTVKRKEKQPYDKDEIWAIFNRGKKKSNFYDDESDLEMEATTEQIFNEEKISQAQAFKEDLIEMKLEKQLLNKKKKKN